MADPRAADDAPDRRLDFCDWFSAPCRTGRGGTRAAGVAARATARVRPRAWLAGMAHRHVAPGDGERFVHPRLRLDQARRSAAPRAAVRPGAVESRRAHALLRAGDSARHRLVLREHFLCQPGHRVGVFRVVDQPAPARGVHEFQRPVVARRRVAVRRGAVARPGVSVPRSVAAAGGDARHHADAAAIAHEQLPERAGVRARRESAGANPLRHRRVPQPPRRLPDAGLSLDAAYVARRRGDLRRLRGGDSHRLAGDGMALSD